MKQVRITDATKILEAQIKSHDVSNKMFRDQLNYHSLIIIINLFKQKTTYAETWSCNVVCSNVSADDTLNL